VEATETKFKKADVLPIVKYYMDQLGIYDLFSEFVPLADALFQRHRFYVSWSSILYVQVIICTKLKNGLQTIQTVFQKIAI
jgi:hypothetical protein